MSTDLRLNIEGWGGVYRGVFCFYIKNTCNKFIQHILLACFLKKHIHMHIRAYVRMWLCVHMLFFASAFLTGAFFKIDIIAGLMCGKWLARRRHCILDS